MERRTGKEGGFLLAIIAPHIFSFNNLPNGKYFNMSELKAFADDMLNVDKMAVSSF